MLPMSVGSYFNSFFEMASRTADLDSGDTATWLSSWTIFYWAWWISWSPFVGMFVARIFPWPLNPRICCWRDDHPRSSHRGVV